MLNFLVTCDVILAQMNSFVTQGTSLINSIKTGTKGLAQHFRAKHAGFFFDEEKFTRETWQLFKFLHGEGTKQHLERLTAGRLRQVYFVAFLLFSSYCIYFTLYF